MTGTLLSFLRAFGLLLAVLLLGRLAIVAVSLHVGVHGVWVGIAGEAWVLFLAVAFFYVTRKSNGAP